MNDNNAAKKEYLEVLELMERYNTEGALVRLKIDELQQIHTLHNLFVLLKEFSEEPSENLDVYPKLQALEEKYMSKFEKAVTIFKEKNNNSFIRYIFRRTKLRTKFLLVRVRFWNFKILLLWTQDSGLLEPSRCCPGRICSGNIKLVSKVQRRTTS